ncbi:hypothetical protein OIU78_010512 [Salix suchowensis]|nr:hypothetical protein OIU78_010512 [Salix suchowensis]
MIFKYQGRKNVSDDRYKLRSNSKDEEMFSVSRRDSTDQDTTLASSSSVGSISEDEADSRKPVSYRFIPPPYRRTAAEKQSKIEEPLKSSDEIAAEEANHPDDSTKPKPRSVRRRPLKPPPGHEDFGSIERPLKPPPGRERAGSIASDEAAGIYTGAMKQEEPGRGFRIFQTEDGEEKVVDGLLRHDSKNDSPRDAGKSMRHRNAISELPLPPGRGNKAERISSSNRRRNRALVELFQHIPSSQIMMNWQLGLQILREDKKISLGSLDSLFSILSIL